MLKRRRRGARIHGAGSHRGDTLARRTTGAGPSSSGSIPRPTHPAERSRVAGSATSIRNSRRRTSRSWAPPSTRSRRTRPSRRSSSSRFRCSATCGARSGWPTAPPTTPTAEFAKRITYVIDPRGKDRAGASEGVAQDSPEGDPGVDRAGGEAGIERPRGRRERGAAESEGSPSRGLSHPLAQRRVRRETRERRRGRGNVRRHEALDAVGHEIADAGHRKGDDREARWPWLRGSRADPAGSRRR